MAHQEPVSPITARADTPTLPGCVTTPTGAANTAIEAQADAALCALLAEIRTCGYRFTTPTPATHQRYLANRGRDAATSLRDIFGWNLPFAGSTLPPALHAALHRAGVLVASGNLFRSSVRIASLDDLLLLHSAYPTTQEDAIFFGPDTYRFARFIAQALDRPARTTTARRILDVGCGSGAGGLFAALELRRRDPAMPAPEVVMNDINPQALRFTAVNASVAGVGVTLAQGDGPAATQGQFDLIISNPPYMQDTEKRAYRDGGEGLGRALSVRIAEQALQRLAPGGRLLLYTGVAMTDAHDPFLAAMRPSLDASGCDWSYDEIDPDVFGEELERPGYAQVERIAAVGLVASRSPARG